MEKPSTYFSQADPQIVYGKKRNDGLVHRFGDLGDIGKLAKKEKGVSP